MTLSARRFGANLLILLGLAPAVVPAQDLVPRAYVITPKHSNAVILTYSFLSGAILLDQTLPIAGSSGRINIGILSYYHGFSFFGRSANITASLPYALGHFRANVQGTETAVYRSGLLDSTYRLAVNLTGGPAMSVNEFRSWKQKRLLGASLKVMAPTGQYDPTLLINPGNNRWAFKPELGYSRRWDHWVLDVYGGVWFFTTNKEFFSHNRFFPGINTQKESPIGAFEGHFSYDFRPRFWVSLDGNFWRGGETSLNGIANPSSLQSNSRAGVTASIPVTGNQSIKFSFSRGAYIRFGGAFNTLSIGWQYSWLGKPN
jgi:hypothetical protein